jgi:hypothetical protein
MKTRGFDSMAGRQKTTRDRVPQQVVDEICNLIREGARQLDAADTGNVGYDTTDIVRKVHAAAYREGKGHIAIVFDDWVARLVPGVLGSIPNKRSTFWQPLLPKMVLPAYFSVPPERDDKGKAIGHARWKRDRKTTPNELGRLIEHERSDIAGRQTELQKKVVVRDTALRRGCDPDEPIGPVMDDDGPRPSAEMPIQPHL